jgi:hypothetical protein
MTDIYLKFQDQSEALSIMIDFTYTDDEGTVHLSQGSHQYALWEVGEIPGKSGYHVNIRVIDPEFDISTLLEYQVYPDKPFCVWA